MTAPPIPLFERLPEIHRTRDAELETPGQLKAYLGLIDEAFLAIHTDIWRLYDDLFVESATDWAVPYIGDLLGTRMVLNELIAYSKLGPLKATLDPKSFTIATYALCGFANFGSIGIQIGGIGALAPERRGDLARLGLRALLAGTFANFMTACIAGMLV